MIWDNASDANLKQLWEGRPPEEEATAFDRRIAALLACSARAVQTRRADLRLVKFQRPKLPGPKPGEVVDVDETLAFERRLATEKLATQPSLPPQPIASEDGLEDEIVDQLERERCRLQNAAHRKDIRKAIQAKLRSERLSEMIVNSLQRLDPPERINLNDRPAKQEEEVVILVSDCQIGSKAHQDYVRGVTKFDSVVFLQRAQVFTRAIAKIIRDRSLVSRLSCLRVFLLGDIIDGDGIFGSQPYELDQSVIDQVVTGAQALSTMISSWSAMVPQVKVHAIPGNHGAIGYHKSPRDNWEYLIYEMMKLQLKDHDAISFDNNRSPFTTVDVQGWRFLLTHGDEIRGRIPVNAAVHREGDWRGLLKEQQFDYYVFGHHHRQISIETNGGEIFCNGCWPGGSAFSIGKLQLISRPSQLVLGVTRAEGVNWRYRVDLERFPI